MLFMYDMPTAAIAKLSHIDRCCGGGIEKGPTVAPQHTLNKKETGNTSDAAIMIINPEP